MAMNKSVLANSLENKMIILFQEMLRRATDDDNDNDYDEKDYAREMAKIIADEVVTHITQNADVEVNIPVAGTLETFVAGVGSNGGSLTGANSGGPVVISGSVNIGPTTAGSYKGVSSIS